MMRGFCSPTYVRCTVCTYVSFRPPCSIFECRGGGGYTQLEEDQIRREWLSLMGWEDTSKPPASEGGLADMTGLQSSPTFHLCCQRMGGCIHKSKILSKMEGRKVELRKSLKNKTSLTWILIGPRARWSTGRSSTGITQSLSLLWQGAFLLVERRLRLAPLYGIQLSWLVELGETPLVIGSR